MSVIEVQELAYRYHHTEDWVLRDVDMHAADGEIVLLLGPSGSGKSTLARCLNGLIPYSLPGERSGRVEVCGREVVNGSRAELTQRVGIVFQNPETQFVTTTVEDEIAFGLENIRLPRAEIEARIGEALAQVGLSGFERRRIESLSGGEKQRLALACQLAMRPQVLVFDEPTANLDPQGTSDVFEILSELSERDRHTIVLIEHHCDALMDLVDSVVVLGEDGRTKCQGSPAEVLSERTDLLRTEGVRMPAVTRLADRLRDDGVWPDSRPLPASIGEAKTSFSEVFPPLRPVGRRATDRSASPTALSDDGSRTDREPAIELRGLEFAYEDQTPAEDVLQGIDLVVPDGAFLAVVGPNGAGKSTLAKHCTGLLSPSDGTVYVGGRDIATVPTSERSREIGYVFQNPEHQFVTESVRAELSYGLEQLGVERSEIDARVDRALSQFGLEHCADANPFTLSYGEKRRLSVATMLVVGQETLILDEPTYGQDRANAETLMETCAELHAAGRTIVMLTHDMSLVAEYAESVVVLVDGEISFHGTPAALFSDPALLAEARLSRPPLATLAEALCPADVAAGELATFDRFCRACVATRRAVMAGERNTDGDGHGRPDRGPNR